MHIIANVLFCTMYVGAINVSAPQYFSEGISPGELTNVACSGSETELLQCSHNSSRGLHCDTAGVVCQGIVHGKQTELSIVAIFHTILPIGFC